MPVLMTPFRPRIHINSFPKSGTHLAIFIIAHIAHRQQPRHWLGSFKKNSWSTEWHTDDCIIPVIEGQPACTWMIGHMGWKKTYYDAFQKMRTCNLFIYRDLRDVVVSQTYHIENPDDRRFRHPDKQLYWDMETHEDRMKAVITGIDGYPGVIDRWELYAPWLEMRPNVLPIKFEDMIDEPELVARKTVDYCIERTIVDDMPIMLAESLKRTIVKSVENLQMRDSGSFRKGIIGSWKNEFTPEILELFNQHERGWLERLGYEKEENIYA
jgi:hypothetical protein